MKYPGRLIKQGETDKAIVKAIQQRLTALGIGNLENTGVFGVKTTAAVKEFQGTHRDRLGNPLVIDGKIGAITWEVLFDQSGVAVNDTTTNKLLAAAIIVAGTQVGVMEKPPGSNKGPEVEMYLKSVGLGPGNFWCAAFVYWCFNEAAKTLNRDNPVFKTAGCLVHWNKTTGKKILKKDAVNDPTLIKPGHIFIMDFGGGHGHTGIVVKVNGGFLETIEGNSNPAGSSNGIGVFRLNTRKINTNAIKGFIEYQ